MNVEPRIERASAPMSQRYSLEEIRGFVAETRARKGITAPQPAPQARSAEPAPTPGTDSWGKFFNVIR